MGRRANVRALLGLAIAMLVFSDAAAGEIDCAHWALDGYHLGMRGDELLAVRSLTLHVEGQAQAIEPGRFRGVVVLDGLNSLKKWDVIYQTQDGTALRAELRERFGEPTSDVAGDISEEEPGAGRQRRTIWWSRSCDVALIVYEDGGGGETAAHTVHATLVRASSLPRGFIQWKTLYR